MLHYGNEQKCEKQMQCGKSESSFENFIIIKRREKKKQNLFNDGVENHLYPRRYTKYFASFASSVQP